MTRRMLIVENSYGGHFLTYIRYLVDETIRRGWVPHVAVPRATIDSEEFQISGLATYRDLDVRVSNGEVGFAQLGRLAREVQADAVIIPNGDGILRGFSWRAACRLAVPVRLLIMAPPNGPLSAKSLLKRLFLRGVSLLPNLEVKYLTTASLPVERGCVPDPVNSEVPDRTPRLVRRVERWANGRKVYLLVGVVQAWKNPDLVIKAFRAANVDGACLVIAGPQSDAVREELNLATPGSPDILVCDQRLDEAEFNSLVSLAHAVVLAYSTHAPNSTAAKAYALRTNIVAAGSKRFLDNVLGIGAQPCVADLELDGLASALRLALNVEPPSPDLLAGPQDFAMALLPNFGED